MNRYGLEHHGISNPGTVHWNLSVSRLVEEAIQRGEGMLTSTGALTAKTRKRTGRSPGDKFVVEEASSRDKIWWGKVNQPIAEGDYLNLRKEVTAYLQGKELFVMDGFAGADPPGNGVHLGVGKRGDKLPRRHPVHHRHRLARQRVHLHQLDRATGRDDVAQPATVGADFFRGRTLAADFQK